jgi:hypothetical protein
MPNNAALAYTSSFRDHKRPLPTIITARFRIDLNDRGHPRNQYYAVWHLIDIDMDGNALCKPRPREDRIDGCEPWLSG